MLRKIDWESQIGRRLRLRDLHVFQTVVQRRSMAKAAQQLGVSQPAVSEVIADLEHMLGVRLVDRSVRGVEPTIYGNALLKRSVAAFDELKQSIRDIEFLSDPTTGEVRIAAPMALATGYVAAIINKFARRHPRILCHLIVDGTYRSLQEREADLMITRVVEPISEDHMEVEVLYADPLCVVAATTNPWSRRRKVGLADLVDEPWALPPADTRLGAAFADIFRAGGLDLPGATVISEGGAARIGLVAKGQFLTITAESWFAGREMTIKALPISLPETHRPVGIITMKNRTLTPVAQLFIECARELARPLASGGPVSTRRPQDE